MASNIKECSQYPVTALATLAEKLCGGLPLYSTTLVEVTCTLPSGLKFGSRGATYEEASSKAAQLALDHVFGSASHTPAEQQRVCLPPAACIEPVQKVIPAPTFAKLSPVISGYNPEISYLGILNEKLSKGMLRPLEITITSSGAPHDTIFRAEVYFSINRCFYHGNGPSKRAAKNALAFQILQAWTV